VISSSGKDITVQLATDGSGVSTTTANDIIAAWNQTAIATIAKYGDGTGIVQAMAKKYFTTSLGTIGIIILPANMGTSKAGYRSLIIAASEKTASLSTFSIAATDADECPDYAGANDGDGNQQVSTAVTALIADVGATAFSAAWKTIWGYKMVITKRYYVIYSSKTILMMEIRLGYIYMPMQIASSSTPSRKCCNT
jgi:hypothetical protein